MLFIWQDIFFAFLIYCQINKVFNVHVRYIFDISKEQSWFVLYHCYNVFQKCICHSTLHSRSVQKLFSSGRTETSNEHTSNEIKYTTMKKDKSSCTASFANCVKALVVSIFQSETTSEKCWESFRFFQCFILIQLNLLVDCMWNYMK